MTGGLTKGHNMDIPLKLRHTRAKPHPPFSRKGAKPRSSFMFLAGKHKKYFAA